MGHIDKRKTVLPELSLKTAVFWDYNINVILLMSVCQGMALLFPKSEQLPIINFELIRYTDYSCINADLNNLVILKSNIDK